MEIKNKKGEKCFKHVKMKSLRTPAIFVSMTGWIHIKRGKIRTNGEEISSNWLEQKQRYFNAYCAELYKITGNLIFPFRKELETLQDILKEESEKQSEKEEEAAGINRKTIKEMRTKAILKEEIQNIKTSCKDTEKRIKELTIMVDELEHESFQILQKTKERAESKMLVYLQGAGVIHNRGELIKEAIREAELYQRYHKYNNQI